MTAFQAAGNVQRVMAQMFDESEFAAHKVFRFQAAGGLTPVSPGMKAQDWADQALDGAKLKQPYADIPVSGLLLVRDTLIRLAAA